MKTALTASIAASTIASLVHADFLGWTANVRNASGGGFLVNLFAVVNHSGDALLNVYGGSPGANAGSITTTSAGGFLQSSGQPTFKPSTNQSWTTLDSFLTIGGGFNTTTNAWQGNSSTVGDVPWEYELDGSTLDGFSTAPDPDNGITNPYVNVIPVTGGWYAGPTGSPARSLATLSNRVSSSNAAAAGGTLGIMVAQLFVQGGPGAVIDMTRMGVTVKRGADGQAQQAVFSLTGIPVPGPGAIALLSVVGVAAQPARRRRV